MAKPIDQYETQFSQIRLRLVIFRNPGAAEMSLLLPNMVPSRVLTHLILVGSSMGVYRPRDA